MTAPTTTERARLLRMAQIQDREDANRGRDVLAAQRRDETERLKRDLADARKLNAQLAGLLLQYAAALSDCRDALTAAYEQIGVMQARRGLGLE